jgi:hypothetical protein
VLQNLVDEAHRVPNGDRGLHELVGRKKCHYPIRNGLRERKLEDDEEAK